MTDKPETPSFLNDAQPSSNPVFSYSNDSKTKSQIELERRNVAEMNRNLRAIHAEEGQDYPKADIPFGPELKIKMENAERLTLRRIKAALKGIKSARNVDLCFLVDGTGSMAQSIRDVKACISQVCDYLTTKKTGHSVVNTLRLALIIYRDFSDKDRQFEIMPYSESVSDFKQQLEKVVASGGGDTAEDVFGGLEKVTQLQWNAEAGTRVLFHLADSPCHGKEYHNDVSDDYPDGDPEKRNINDLLEKLKNSQVRYYFGKITSLTDKMIEKFSEILNEPITVFDLTQSAMDYVIKTLVKESVMSSSIHSLLDVKEKRPKKFRLERKMPDWNIVSEVTGVYMSYNLPNSLEEVIDCVPFERKVEKDVKLKIAPNPFDNGAMRIAYFGVAIGKLGSTDIVVKEDKYDTKSNPRVVYETYLAMQTVAAYMAKEFELELSKRSIQTQSKIKYINAKMLTVFQASNALKYYLCEPLLRAPICRLMSKKSAELAARVATAKSTTEDAVLPFLGSISARYKRRTIILAKGEATKVDLLPNDAFAYLPQFVRFSNNADYLADIDYLKSKLNEAGVDEKQLDLLFAFSHWTYEHSHGCLMVVDLQGVLTVDELTGKSVLMLTDPAIHSTNTLQFRPSNLGQKGMKMFFNRHSCNEFCEKLELPSRHEEFTLVI